MNTDNSFTAKEKMTNILVYRKDYLPKMTYL